MVVRKSQDTFGGLYLISKSFPTPFDMDLMFSLPRAEQKLLVCLFLGFVFVYWVNLGIRAHLRVYHYPPA